jgi:hypothetical protein
MIIVNGVPSSGLLVAAREGTSVKHVAERVRALVDELDG